MKSCLFAFAAKAPNLLGALRSWWLVRRCWKEKSNHLTFLPSYIPSCRRRSR